MMLDLVFEEGTRQISNTEFYVSFVADIKALALQTYFVTMARPEEGNM